MKSKDEEKCRNNTKEEKGDDFMSKRSIDKTGITGLNKEKIEILKRAKGAASSPLDLNKVRDYIKYGEEN